MTTTIIPYTPNINSAPLFTTTFVLDNQSYQGTVTYNFAAQRTYLTLTDSNGNLTWSGALVGSPIGYNIYLALGIFQNTQLLYRADTGNFEVITS